MEQVETKVDVLAVMDRLMSAPCDACNGDCGSANPPVIGCPQREAIEARAAIDELIEAAREMDAVFDTYVFDYGVTQHGLSVKDRISAAIARVGGGK